MLPQNSKEELDLCQRRALQLSLGICVSFCGQRSSRLQITCSTNSLRTCTNNGLGLQGLSFASTGNLRLTLPVLS